MTFEQRKAAALSLLVAFLGRTFSPPRGLSDQDQASRISAIADAFARRMPITGDYEELVGKVLQKVADTHFGSSWPTQAVFVDAMPHKELAGMRPAPQTYTSEDKVQAIANKMNEGQPVPEYWVWGQGSNKLMGASAITRDTLDAYRRGSVKAFIDAYRGGAAEIMEERIGPIVREYFMDRAV